MARGAAEPRIGCQAQTVKRVTWCNSTGRLTRDPLIDPNGGGVVYCPSVQLSSTYEFLLDKSTSDIAMDGKTVAFPFQSKHWYWPVSLVLMSGYAIGGMVPIALHFYSLLRDQIPAGLRPIVLSFMLGLLGANVQLSIAFARDVNTVMTSATPSLPSCFDWFGYLLKQVWGGIAAVFFVLATKLGFLAAVASSGSNLRLPAVVVISFCAGLRAFQILKVLAGIVPIKRAEHGSS